MNNTNVCSLITTKKIQKTRFYSENKYSVIYLIRCDRTICGINLTCVLRFEQFIANSVAESFIIVVVLQPESSKKLTLFGGAFWNWEYQKYALKCG